MDIGLKKKIDKKLIFSYSKYINDIKKEREIIFLCVGCSKIWFDSFGPIMGSLLKKMNLNCFVYGDCKSNITSFNLRKYIDAIYLFHNNPFIVVFDNAYTSDNVVGLKIKRGDIICDCFNNNECIGHLCFTYCLNRESMMNCKNFNKMMREINCLANTIKFIFN